MDWLEEAAAKLKRKNTVLFSKGSELLGDLALLLPEQDGRTVVLWALDLAEGSVKELEAWHPGEARPREALLAAREWAAGRIKMRRAQRCILDCHALAKELDRPEDAALCHAVGQACSVVHTAGHALGYPMYELTSMVYRLGPENCREAIEARAREYVSRLLCWAGRLDEYEGSWAGFMLARPAGGGLTCR